MLLLLLSARALAQQYVISTVAGGAPPPTPSLALAAAIGSPQAVATDAPGNLYFAGHNVVLKVDTSGMLTRVAGNASGGYSGDGGPATDAQLNAPSALAVDPTANLYIADTNNNVIRMVTPDGMIQTVAGNGAQSYSGDGGPAMSAGLNAPRGVAVGANGALYISDTGNNRVRMVSTSGIISTVAGGGPIAFGAGYTGPARGTRVWPFGLAADSSGALYFVDYVLEAMIRKISSDGVMTTINVGDLVLPSVNGVAVDATDNLYVLDEQTGYISRLFAGGTSGVLVGGLNHAGGIAVDVGGNLYIADTGNNQIRRITRTPAGGAFIIAGSGIADYSGDGGPATGAQFSDARSVALDATGDLYIADAGNHTVRVVAPNGVIVTVAGNGIAGFSGDGGPAGLAKLHQPQGVAVGASGELYIADTGNGLVRKISADSGVITTVAPPLSAGYFTLTPVALTSGLAGELYISNRFNNQVYKLLPNGVHTSVAGTSYAPACIPYPSGWGGCTEQPPAPLGDGGPATGARLFPAGLAIDAAGDLYIADAGDGLVRMVSPNQIISTVAGNPGASTTRLLNDPEGVAIDAAGNQYIADYANYRILKVAPDGTMTTIAGNGTQGHSGDGGPANSAQLSGPRGLAVDSAGNIYVADSDSVRLLRPVASPDTTISSGAVLP